VHRTAKKGCGNKRTRKALLITYELVKHWMKSSAKLRKEMETGKQSGVAFPGGSCRVGKARPQKHTKTKQKYFIMLQIICFSSSLALRLRLRRRCAVQRGVEIACPCQRRKGAETTIQTHNVDKIAALIAKGGSGFSVQPCRRGSVRFGYFRSLLVAAMSRHRKLCCPEAFMILL
jgi:hypothetical protein